MRERAHRIGGQLDVRSRAGRGTEVTLSLPIARSEARVTPIRVLLVDDHTLFRRGIKALLSRQPGFEVVGEAADGLEG